MLDADPILLQHFQRPLQQADFIGRIVPVHRDDGEVFFPGNAGDEAGTILLLWIDMIDNLRAGILRLIRISDHNWNVRVLHRIDRILMQHIGSHIG